VAERTVGLALSSGGARGAAHIGVLRVLEENGIVPDVVAGTSMGAYVGGAYACGVSLDDLENEWHSTSFLRTARTMLPTIPWSGWTSGGEIVRTLRRTFDQKTFRDLERPFAALATDLELGTPYAITDGSLVDAVRASLSVPGLFTPVWLNDRLLIDGGVSNPLPIDVVRSMGADVVIAVDVLVDPSEVHMTGLPYFGTRERRLDFAKTTRPDEACARRYHPSVFAVLFQMSTVFQRRLCDVTLASSPPDVRVRPDFSPDPPTYSRVGCAIDAGAAAARQALPAIRRAIELAG
jgi:NTE family protein